jgi:GT2 family glycosyltransferase
MVNAALLTDLLEHEISLWYSQKGHTSMKDMKVQVAIVLIGRNEGERLRKALESIPNGLLIVYVDSRSTDDSVALAKQKGCIVVELDMSLPFTAARARNEGFAALICHAAQTEYVQFIDGDCEIAPDWLPKAIAALADHEEVALVCGRRREKYPQSSHYTSVIDMEWHTPLGYIEACGGDFLIRVSAFQEVEGFDSAWIAGEEPELCLRLRQRGWKLLRIDHDMTFHDAHITRFLQLWRRSIRSGHAFAEGFWNYGHTQERYCVKQILSILFWSFCLPFTILTTFIPSDGITLIALFCYLFPYSRMISFQEQKGYPKSQAKLYARFILMLKFAELFGIITFLYRRLTRRSHTLIEYKSL